MGKVARTEHAVRFGRSPPAHATPAGTWPPPEQRSKLLSFSSRGWAPSSLTAPLPAADRQVLGAGLNCSGSSWPLIAGVPGIARLRLPHEIASDRLPSSRCEMVYRSVDDVMRLELHYPSDLDLTQPAMQVEILAADIARCLRDYPHGGEGVITLGGVKHCFMYVVQDDVVDAVHRAARLYRAGPQRASAKTGMKRATRCRLGPSRHEPRLSQKWD